MDNTLYFPVDQLRDMVPADHVIGIESDLMERDIASRMYNPKLSALRAQHQGLAIAPLTNKAIAVVLAANVAVDINLPTGTKMVRFNSDGFFVVSRNGRAQLPPAALVTGDANCEIGSFWPAFDTYYYVEEIKQLSMLSDLQVRVSIECFAQI
jgi:hypothetical protein